MSIGLLCDNIREIVLIPYKIDEKGTIYIKPMLRSEVEKMKGKMKRLVDMGIFHAEDINIKEEDKK